MINFWIGCDSGTKGGITFFDSSRRIITAVPIPHKRVKKLTGGSNGEIDFDKLRKIFDDVIGAGMDRRDVIACIERVHATAFGAISNFSMGKEIGSMIALFHTRGFRVVLLPMDGNASWQTMIFGKGVKSSDKSRSLRLARKLYPEHAHLLRTARGKDLDGVSDSMLIGRAGQLKVKKLLNIKKRLKKQAKV